MTRAPLVSVVIPAHNSAGTLGEALESVASQTARADEVIVVDDGSADGSAECAERAYPGCIVIRQANAGPGAARNAGVARARGEWVAFLDADDAWLPWRLETQLRLAARDPGVAMWCGHAERIGGVPEDGLAGPEAGASPSAPPAEPPVSGLTLGRLAQSNLVATSTVLVRRSALAAAGGFDPQFRGPEDYDLWLRLAARGPIAFIDALLARYRHQEGSLSTDAARFLPQIVRVLDKAYAPGGALHGRRGKGQAKAYHYMACSWMAARRGELGPALRLFGASFRFWPWWFGRYAGLRWPRPKLMVFFVKTGVRRIRARD